MRRLPLILVLAAVLCASLFVATARAESTAAFLDAEVLGPHDSRISGEMLVDNWRWYGFDVLPQLVILGAETSLGDPRLGGQLVWENNFGSLRYHGANSRWGELADGRAWIAGKDWYSFPSPEIGMMAFGRYLKVGVDGFYRRALGDTPYDWEAFASVYYGRGVPGLDRYIRNLRALESRFREKAAEAGFVW